MPDPSLNVLGLFYREVYMASRPSPSEPEEPICYTIQQSKFEGRIYLEAATLTQLRPVWGPSLERAIRWDSREAAEASLRYMKRNFGEKLFESAVIGSWRYYAPNAAIILKGLKEVL